MPPPSNLRIGLALLARCDARGGGGGGGALRASLAADGLANPEASTYSVVMRAAEGLSAGAPAPRALPSPAARVARR